MYCARRCDPAFCRSSRAGGKQYGGPTLFDVGQDAAADCCAKKGGEVDIRSPYYNTNDNNPRNWVRLSGTRASCKFTSLKDGSRIHVLPYTLHTKQPWQHVQESHAHLSSSQRTAVEQIVSGRDKIMGVEGVAGAGKTTSLSAPREAVECEGHQVIGLAPTSRAAHKLAESGIESGTLQRHLIRPEALTDGQERLFVSDESSLAGTEQMNEFFHRLRTAHVLLVGDTNSNHTKIMQ